VGIFEAFIWRTFFILQTVYIFGMRRLPRRCKSSTPLVWEFAVVELRYPFSFNIKRRADRYYFVCIGAFLFDAHTVELC